MRRPLFVLLLLPALALAPGFVARRAMASDIIDATGRTVQVPDHVARVLPAGGPAAVLLEALAPDLMLGWPTPLPTEKRALLAPEAAALPDVPHVAGRGNTLDAIRALNPDLILDYGTVSPDYIALARSTQERSGIATVLLDGRLAETPRVLRLLGAALHREQRAETLARLAEALLAVPPVPGKPPRVAYVRGTDMLKLAAPGTGATEVFTRLGWQVVAPPGDGWFRVTTQDAIAAFDPDIVVFSDAGMRAVVAASPAWRALRAVRDGHAYIEPASPFGWINEPPSLNQVLGVAWLAGGDAATLAATFSAVVYGHVLTADDVRAVADTAKPLRP